MADWGGTSGEVHNQLMAALGTPSKLRDIAFINRPAWDAVVGAFKVSTTAGGTTTERDPNPRIEIFRRVAFLRLGATPRSVRSVGAYNTDGCSCTAAPLPGTGTTS